MLRTGKKVILQEMKGLQALAGKLDKQFERAIEWLHVPGTVILTGVGKSGHVCRKLAATMTSMGTRAVFIHPTEAAHGDLGMIARDDALLALSRSGQAQELFPVVKFAQDLEIPRVLISENDQNGLSALVNCTIRIPKISEAWGHAPTTSTVMQMAAGDALAVALADARGYTIDDFNRTHPGGALGNGSNSRR